MSIKNTLMEAGRYDQIMDILKKILFTSEYSFPVACHLDNGKASFRVSGADVRVEAGRLMESIKDNSISNMGLEDFENLYQYVKNCCDTMLHNYAISISHRKTPEKDMDVIRQWCILDNLIVCLGIERDEEGHGWYVPEGWKKTE